MNKRDTEDAKKRIFDAAASLFAQKGFNSVGVREIAGKADVNISMINYYFKGKAGILKDIINKCYHSYSQTIRDVGDEDMPLEKHIRLMVRTVINYFRENTEIALVSFDAIPLDSPEILGLKVEWAARIRSQMRWFHKKLGLDPDNPVHMSLGPGALIAIIYSHFQTKYASENFPQLKEYAAAFNDEFYEKFSEHLADFVYKGLEDLRSSRKRGG